MIDFKGSCEEYLASKEVKNGWGFAHLDLQKGVFSPCLNSNY
ncbi:hypothetical protein [Helicobacter felistomachi]|nr:hypothetical protein [Helicobacter sp. NHP21005]